MEWYMRGACLGQSPKVFVPDESPDKDETSDAHQLALSFCARCDVVEPCLEFALAVNEQYGVWGNMTPRQRRRLRENRQRNRARVR